MVFKLYARFCLCSKAFGIFIKQIRQGQFSVPISAAVIVDDMGTRYGNVYDECYKKYNCNEE